MSNDTCTRGREQFALSALEEIEGLQQAIRGGATMYPSDLEGVRQKLEKFKQERGEDIDE